MEYKTVLNSACAEVEEKKSRFIANVIPVEQEEDAVNFIGEIKTRYWDAAHNVYAYYIEDSTPIQRYSDDGEPSGTAGMPVLEVIKRMGVSNVAVVVTRYFGGTLLGASGLIRAYSKSAAAGITAAGVVRKLLCHNVLLTVEYTLFGRIQNLLHTEGYIVKNIEYGQDVEIGVYVPGEELESFCTLMTEAASANILIENSGTEYITLDESGKYIR